jgi:hypothetical protein
LAGGDNSRAASPSAGSRNEGHATSLTALAGLPLAVSGHAVHTIDLEEAPT